MQLVRLDLSCHALDGGIPVGLRALRCLEVWAAEARAEHWQSSTSVLCPPSFADGVTNYWIEYDPTKLNHDMYEHSAEILFRSWY